MNVFRRLERRLESLLDGAVAGVFRGPLHPTELAIRLAREADLATENRPDGPLVPNYYRLSIAPADLEGTSPPARLKRWLADGLEELALERGWRMDGPATVELSEDESVARGSPSCIAEIRLGERRAWATLHGDTDIEVTVNRAVIGRGADADVQLPDDTASRRHALLWTEGETIFLRDLGSANGTSVDGVPIDETAQQVPAAARLTFGDASYIVRRS